MTTARGGNWRRVFGIPLVIGALTLAGLLAALLGGQAGRVFAWFGTGLPVAVVAMAWCRRA